MWELDHKESWVTKNWCFWTVLLEKTLESPRTTRRSNKSSLKEISTEYSLERLIVELNIQYFSHLMLRTDSLEKTLMLGIEDWRQDEKGMTEEEMVGWHHWLNGHEFEQAGELEMGREACHAAVHGVAKSRIQLSDWTELNWRQRKKKMLGVTGDSVVENPPASVGDVGSILDLGRFHLLQNN